MARKRIKELIKLINQANYDYYALDNPTISDEYDRYMQELINLKYPEFIINESPTVGGTVVENFLRLFIKIQC